MVFSVVTIVTMIGSTRKSLTPRREKLLVYRVEQTAGQWLRLVAEEDEVSGWASVDRIVPLDQAIETYTEEIRAQG